MIISVSLHLLNIFVITEGYSAAAIAFIFAFPMLYCIYPVANSYINSLFSRGEKIEMKIKNYVVPIFIFVFTLGLLLFLGRSEFKSLVLSISSYGTDFPPELEIYIWIIYVLYYLQFLYFMRRFILINKKYKGNHEFSFAAKWLKYIIFVAFLYETVLIAAWFAGNETYLIDSLISNFTILVFGVIGFKHDEILYQLKLKEILKKNPITVNGRKIKSKFEEDSQNEIVNQIKTLIVDEKLYLNPHLKIKNFAKRLHLPEKELSILINDVLGKNFTSFVNEFRVKEACKLLKNNDLKISDISSEVGFYSRSAFNTAFKEVTGLTPTEYRSKH